jgi:tetratricopeptide (TPR) repeat protein
MLPIGFCLVLVLFGGCRSAEEDETPASGPTDRSDGAAPDDYALAARKEATAENMKNFHSLSYYQEALLYYQASLRNAPDGWPRRREVNRKISTLSARVRKLRRWKAVLDEVHRRVPDVSRTEALRKPLLEKCRSVLEEADVAFVTEAARRLQGRIAEAFLRVVKERLSLATRRSREHTARGRYMEALTVWEEFPREYREDYAEIDRLVRERVAEIDRAARGDFEALVVKRVDYLLGRRRFHGAAFVVRRARERFVGQNKLLDRIEKLDAEIARRRRIADAEAKRAPKPPRKPVPKPKPTPRPKPKPVPKPGPAKSKPEEVRPHGAMGGSLRQVVNPLGKARKAFKEAQQLERNTMPGSENADANLRRAVALYREAQELFELCQDNRIGNAREIEELLEEINQGIFWCQKRRKIR